MARAVDQPLRPANVKVVQQMLGHASAAMTLDDAYAHRVALVTT